MPTKRLTAIDHNRTSEDPAKSLAAAVIYQALEDILSSNSERAQEARMFLFSKLESCRIVRNYWLDVLGLQPYLMDRLQSLNHEQLRARLRHASRKQRLRQAA